MTNDDGIDSPGLHALVEALADVGDVMVVAPDRNRSAVSRSITLGQTLMVEEQHVPGASVAYATDGTPTDCVRLAALGLVGHRPNIVVSGANHGLNLGDDVTYSGTVAAAFEGLVMGIPGIAVSQQSLSRELGYPRVHRFDFSSMKLFVRQLVEYTLTNEKLEQGTMLNVNVPGVPPTELEGVEVGVLGRRIYRDKLELHSEAEGRRHFSIYGDDPSHHEEEGTDIAAIGRNCIAVTPIRFELSDRRAIATVESWPLASFLGAPA